MNDSEKFKAFLLGLLAGGLTATVISLLYAPTSGKKLRKKISDKAEGIFEGAEEYYETGKEKAGKIVQEGKKKATEIIEDAKKKITTNWIKCLNLVSLKNVQQSCLPVARRDSQTLIAGYTPTFPYKPWEMTIKNIDFSDWIQIFASFESTRKREFTCKGYLYY